MLRGNSITYASTPLHILSWRPNSELVFVLLSALLTTLLSYQLAAILTDIVFGLKSRDEAKVADIQLLHLLRTSSPISLARSLCPRSFVSGDARRLFDESSSPATVQQIPRVLYIRLIIILVIAPIVNVLAVVLVLESDTVLTFKEASFGGLALGINAGAVNLSNAGHSFAYHVPVLTARNDVSLVDFVFHDETQRIRERLSTAIPKFPNAWIRVMNFRSERFVMALEMPGYKQEHSKAGLLVPRSGRLFDPYSRPQATIRSRISQQQLGSIALIMAERLVNLCGPHLAELVANGDLPSRLAHNDKGDGPEAFLEIPCPVAVSSLDAIITEADEALVPILKLVTFVDYPDLQVTCNDPDEFAAPPRFSDVDGMSFLTRRNSYAAVPVLAVLVLAAIVVRCFVRIVTNNDLERGMCLMLQSVLGVPFSKLLLTADEVFVMHDRHQRFAQVERTC